MDVRFTNQGALQMYSEDNFPWRSTSHLAARHGEDSGAPAANRCQSDTKAPIGPKSGHTLVLKPQDERFLLDFLSWFRGNINVTWVCSICQRCWSGRSFASCNDSSKKCRAFVCASRSRASSHLLGIGSMGREKVWISWVSRDTCYMTFRVQNCRARQVAKRI